MRNVVGAGEVSALGTPGETGVLVLDIGRNSAAEHAGLLKGGVALAADKKAVHDVREVVANSTQGNAGAVLP